jgi:hypothetical protein
MKYMLLIHGDQREPRCEPRHAAAAARDGDLEAAIEVRSIVEW